MKAWQTPAPNKRATVALCIALIWAIAGCGLAGWHWYQRTQDVAILVDYAAKCTIYAQQQEERADALAKRLERSL